MIYAFGISSCDCIDVTAGWLHCDPAWPALLHVVVANLAHFEQLCGAHTQASGACKVPNCAGALLDETSCKLLLRGAAVP